MVETESDWLRYYEWLKRHQSQKHIAERARQYRKETMVDLDELLNPNPEDLRSEREEKMQHAKDARKLRRLMDDASNRIIDRDVLDNLSEVISPEELDNTMRDDDWMWN